MAVAAASPDAKATAWPPSSAPSAASSAPQAVLPSRPYSSAAAWTTAELGGRAGLHRDGVRRPVGVDGHRFGVQRLGGHGAILPDFRGAFRRASPRRRA